MSSVSLVDGHIDELKSLSDNELKKDIEVLFTRNDIDIILGALNIYSEMSVVPVEIKERVNALIPYIKKIVKKQ